MSWLPSWPSGGLWPVCPGHAGVGHEHNIESAAQTANPNRMLPGGQGSPRPRPVHWVSTSVGDVFVAVTHRSHTDNCDATRRELVALLNEDVWIKLRCVVC